MDKPPFTLLELELEVTRYLLGQGWELADPRRLAEQIIAEWSAGEQSQPGALPIIRGQIQALYAEVLHEMLIHGDPAQKERAQMEAKVKIEKSAKRITWEPGEREELLSQIWLKLIQKVEREPLKAPRALFVYILRMLQNARTDLHRRRTAALRRGTGEEVSLDELSGEPAAPMGGETTTRVPAFASASTRGMERTIMDQETEQQLLAFFQRHLANDHQVRTAAGYYLEGLSTREIADLLGTRPDYIRQTKARILNRLKYLPPEARTELEALLRGLPPKEGDDG